MAGKTFVGIGFGAIQSGLFVPEAHKSGHFERLVVAEVLPHVVAAVRQAKGAYRINVARQRGVEVHEIRDLEIYNPLVADDRRELEAAISDAHEIATALPSVAFFDRGEFSPAELLARGLNRKFRRDRSAQAVIYAAENHNEAAQHLRSAVGARLEEALLPQLDRHVQFLNTVIGKMSGVVTDTAQIERYRLDPAVDGWESAFLVEEFNRIFISAIKLKGFRRGIDVFEEKQDLLPFEEAKLYGHNATHALMGYLASREGYEFMADVASDPLYVLARQAFLQESGVALMARHGGLDPLFTDHGWRDYALDLLERMTNPFLQDRVDRVIRDPQRKLGWDDRLVGTMRLALEAEIEPRRFAVGAAAALELLSTQSRGEGLDRLMDVLWEGRHDPRGHEPVIRRLIHEARHTLRESRESHS